jgi:hypothetical protein
LNHSLFFVKISEFRIYSSQISILFANFAFHHATDNTEALLETPVARAHYSRWRSGKWRSKGFA